MSEATVRIRVGGEELESVGRGVGPVNALDSALRQALEDRYPGISDLRLTDYTVRVLDSKDGTSATVRVFIETSNHLSAWGTIGVHENIIAASWQALVDGVLVGLLRLA
jgi:2-isopropylmalate synthase